ncbi:hypothetical protein HHI36_011643, partial [Cryptolaemus montrouzieri]
MSKDRERPDEENHDIDKMNQKLIKQQRPAGAKFSKPENQKTDTFNATTKALMEKRRKLWSNGKYKTVEYVHNNETIKKRIREDLRKHQEQEVEKILRRNSRLNCLRPRGTYYYSFKRQRRQGRK